MKNFLPLFLAPLSFFAASLAFAQVNCTQHLGGVTSCSGPSGYQYESREHLNGQSTYYDNRGNTGTVTHTLNGGVNVSPTHVGSTPPPVPVTSGHPTDNINVGSRMVPYKGLRVN
jgi:hypothetical protein